MVFLRRRKSKNAIRAFSGALLVFFAFGQVVSVLHAAFARHTVCAEHGEAVDVEGDLAAEPPQTAPASDAFTSKTAATDVDGGQHGHCAFGAHRREDIALLAAGLTIVSDVPDLQAALHAPEGAPLAALRVLRNAPKTSPPV